MHIPLTANFLVLVVLCETAVICFSIAFSIYRKQLYMWSVCFRKNLCV